MKIAITGGAGFIGTAMAGFLKEQGHEPVLLDIKKSEAFPEHSVITDVTDKEALTEALEGAEVIYNLAAEHRDDVSPVEKYYDVNVKGAENIVAAAETHNIKTIIFTSTVAVYGLKPVDPIHGSREKDAPSPFNDYGESKREAEKVFEAWVKTGEDRSLTTIRLVATFGPGNRGNIYTLMDQVSRGKFIMVGSGENRKSIAYLGNVTAFLVHCLNFTPGLHVYNYADKPDLSMKELVGDIRSAMGFKGIGPKIPYTLGLMGGLGFDLAAKISRKTFPISAIRVRKFCANTVVDAGKLEETGFKPPFTLREGLKQMIDQEFQNKTKEAA